jgi:hypothetical protein
MLSLRMASFFTANVSLSAAVATASVIVTRTEASNDRFHVGCQGQSRKAPVPFARLEGGRRIVTHYLSSPDSRTRRGFGGASRVVRKITGLGVGSSPPPSWQSEPEHEQHGLIAHISQFRRPGEFVLRDAAQSSRDGDVLLPACFESHRRCVDAAAEVDPPQLV